MEPAFAPFTFSYECDMLRTNATSAQGVHVEAERREGQIYVVSKGSGWPAGTGAQIVNTTELGQRTYSLKGGTGGTPIPVEDLPTGYVSGTTADLPLDVQVYIDDRIVSVYKVVVHRTYLSNS